MNNDAPYHFWSGGEKECLNILRKEKIMATKVLVKSNGSIRIEGEFEIFDQAGAKFDVSGRTVISLCRCGQSATKPFCDGSHRTVGFQSEIKAYALPPPQPK
jgi:CDGSH-type Zn-finger protein